MLRYVPAPQEPLIVDTPLGPGRLLANLAARPLATLVLGHGAGAGPDTDDLRHLAEALPLYGISVLRFEQPWRTAGRRVADRPARLDLAWCAAVDLIKQRALVAGPLILGGRSAGARVALRTAVELGAEGVLAIAFPLRPPGGSGDRTAELLEAARHVPVLVVQGTRDQFGTAAALAGAVPTRMLRRAAPPVAAGICVVPLHSADHRMRVAAGPVTPDEAWNQVDAVVSWWLRSVARVVAEPTAA